MNMNYEITVTGEAQGNSGTRAGGEEALKQRER